MVLRDAVALAQHAPNIGNPDLVVPELIVFGTFVAMNIVLLWVAPQTFLNYSLVSSIEQFLQEELVREACAANAPVSSEEGNTKWTPSSRQEATTTTSR